MTRKRFLPQEHTQQFDVTNAEQQLIECLREIGARRDEARFRLVIELDGGAWEIVMSEQIESLGKKIGASGVGATFDQAWIGMDPPWA
jgi:hypothetical protein